jgi:hypothetical protein
MAFLNRCSLIAAVGLATMVFIVCQTASAEDSAKAVS